MPPDSTQSWTRPVLIAVATTLACAAALGLVQSAREEPLDKHRLGVVERTVEIHSGEIRANRDEINAVKAEVGVVANDMKWVVQAMRDSGITPKSER